jgi:hypothetical protein
MGEGEGSHVWSASDQDLGALKKSLKKGATNDRKGKTTIIDRVGNMEAGA